MQNQRKTIMIQNFGLEQDECEKSSSNSEDEGAKLINVNDPKLNEEKITPYVIINKTDTTFVVKRLFEKDKRDPEGFRRTETGTKKKQLVNYYVLEQGEIIDYMVDYNAHKFNNNKLNVVRTEFNDDI